MGMFDDVNFDYRMPDGYEGGSFQTKDLECDGSCYEISPQGRLLKNEIDQCFDGEFEMCCLDFLTDKLGYYNMVFSQGDLCWFTKLPDNDVRYIFTPASPVAVELKNTTK